MAFGSRDSRRSTRTPRVPATIRRHGPRKAPVEDVAGLLLQSFVRRLEELLLHEETLAGPQYDLGRHLAFGDVRQIVGVFFQPHWPTADDERRDQKKHAELPQRRSEKI